MCQTSRIFGILALFLNLSIPTEQKSVPTECRPSPNAQSTQYIIGYGSLMQTASKSKTDPNTGESLPVTVHGFSRRWSSQNPETVSFTTTFLGVQVDSNASFNAVIFKLPSGDAQTILSRYDNREDWYCRQKVEVHQLKLFDPKLTADSSAEYWVYVNRPEFAGSPDKEHPIIQSYVDTFVSGCLEIEDKYGLNGFTAQCVDSTHGWNEHWVNDRIFPRRPLLYQPNAYRIDKILAAQVPVAFKAIVIEG